MKNFLALFLVFTIGCAAVTPSQTETTPTPNKLFSDEPKAPVAKPLVTCEAGIACVPTYRFNSEVSEESVAPAIDWIKAGNEAGANALVLEINTPGGEVWSGFELAKVIENSKVPVLIVVDGEAASMGFYLLQSGHARYMTKRSSLMAHEPSLGAILRGTPNEWQAVASMLKALSNAIAEHCAHRLSITIDEYKSKVTGGQMWWLNWEEAVGVEAVDGTVSSVSELVEDAKYQIQLGMIGPL